MGPFMTINLAIPDIQELKPRITVFGVGGAGGNAVNNMITSGLDGVDFVCANTDAQALALSKSPRIIQLGVSVTEGLGAGSHPEVGRAAAEESFDEINDHLSGSHMVFITAGMGGGTGTGAAPVIARAAREQGILTVGVVTKPFTFEGNRRARLAEDGIDELHRHVDTLIVIPNQNLFRVANEKTTFADAFKMADQVLYSGVSCITDLMVKEGLINLDFADVRAVMRGMGKAMMGTGEASGEDRARHAAEAAIANPLLDDVSMQGARGLLISITGGPDLTLYEVDEAASRIREEVDADANIILGATYDPEHDRHDPRRRRRHRHRRHHGAGARADEGQFVARAAAGEPSPDRQHAGPGACSRSSPRSEFEVGCPPGGRRGDHPPGADLSGLPERRWRDGRALYPGADRRPHRRAGRVRPSRRCRASMCPRTPSVPKASAACRAPRSFRLLRGRHWRPKNDMSPSRAMPARCSSGWPPMSVSACVRSTPGLDETR